MLLEGKRALVMGVANDRSIAWGIARALAAHYDPAAFEAAALGGGARGDESRAGAPGRR